MLKHLSIDQLAELANDNDVKIDKRWKRERIVDTLAKAGVKAPVTALSDKLSDQVDNEPVRFTGGIGSIMPRDNRYVRHEGGDRELIPGLKVEFLDGNGDARGGLSRPFFPDKPDHEDTIECDCATCLADVRDYLSNHRLGKQIAEQWGIREAKVNEPAIPVAGWDNLSATDLDQLHKLLGFDLRNAVRYEKANKKRHDVLDALDKIEESHAEAPDETITDAEIVI